MVFWEGVPGGTGTEERHAGERAARVGLCVSGDGGAIRVATPSSDHHALSAVFSSGCCPGLASHGDRRQPDGDDWCSDLDRNRREQRDRSDRPRQ